MPPTALAKTAWAPPPDDYVLPREEVHVWRIALDRLPSQFSELEAVLSDGEKQAANRFRMPADRSRAVVGRGALRRLLGRCLGTRPEHLRFDCNAFGKPHLADGSTATPLQFNVSHSGELILIALTIGRTLGIDVEWMKPDLQVTEIAKRFFSPRERSALASLPADRQHGAFFACWTRKEAFIKAIGNGLSHPLDCFDVSLRPGETPRLEATRPDPAEAHRWEMRELDVGDDYKAALVVEGAGWLLRTFGWSDAGFPPIDP